MPFIKSAVYTDHRYSMAHLRYIDKISDKASRRLDQHMQSVSMSTTATVNFDTLGQNISVTLTHDDPSLEASIYLLADALLSAYRPMLMTLVINGQATLEEEGESV